MPDEPASRFVTSHLVLGATPSTVAGPFTVTDDVLLAVQGLREESTVVLPEGRYDLAEAVLQSIGASPEHIDFSLRYAQGLLPGMQVDKPVAVPTAESGSRS